MTFWEKVKQAVWGVIYRIFVKFRNSLLKAKLIYHEKGRQPYHIGWLAPGKTLEDLKVHLHSEWGFGNHFVAWVDEGQVLSWRKLVDFNNQYHLRVFNDGELRGHFEYTPEGHPIDHFVEKGEKEAQIDFLKFLGEFVVSQKYISHLEVDPSSFDPKSEITVDSKI